MQKIAVFLLFVLACPLWANMASPYDPGSEIGTTFVNRHAKVLHEKLTIRPDSAFNFAMVEAVYNIYLDSSGVEIPLLFVARDYAGDFRVFVDDKGTEATPLSQSKIGLLDKLPFGWERVIDSAATGSNTLELSWSVYHKTHVGMDDLIYFETSLDSGYHQIKVRYQAKTWTDNSEWIKRQFLSYSLSPAKHWQDFGELEVILDNSNFGKEINLKSLGEPHEGNITSVATWRFDELPTDVLDFEYSAKTSRWANLLLGLGPFNISLICIFPFVLIHLLLIIRYRKHNAQGFNLWTIAGGVILPIVWGLIISSSYGWIDSALGEAASGRHGYTIFGIIIAVPILMIIYTLVAVAVDVFLKRRRQR